MNEMTRPATLLAGVSTVGLVSTSIYFSNKTSALSKQISTIDADIDTIKEGLKEKVPALENSIKAVDHGVRSLANGMQNFATHTKKLEKKFTRSHDEVAEMSEALDKIDDRMVRLIEALVSKGVIVQEDIDPPVKPAPIQRARVAKVPEKRRPSSEEDDEEDEVSSEEERDNRRSSKQKNNRATSRSLPPPRRQSSSKDDDGDDIDQVVRMASGRRN